MIEYCLQEVGATPASKFIEDSLSMNQSSAVWKPFFFALAVAVFGATATWGETGNELSISEVQTSTVAVRQERDIETLKKCRQGIIEVLAYLGTQRNRLAPDGVDRPYMPNPSARFDLLAAWACMLDDYAALESIAACHRDFIRLDSPRQQRISFHIFRAALYTGYRHALDFINFVEKNPALHTILNDALPDQGLPKGTYAHFKYKYLNVFKAGEFGAFETLGAYWGPFEDPVLSVAVENDRKRIWKAGKGEGPALTIKNGFDILEHFGRSTWFPVQKGISGWMGDTKVHRVGETLIAGDQIEAIRRRVLPGDILLERREWYMTNIGIPGYWTHAALVVGTPQERKDYFDDRETARWVRGLGADSFEELLKQSFPGAYVQAVSPTETGHLPRVVESISKGVVFTALETSAACDSLAVLRPRLSRAEKARALYSAFRYHGRPYDYGFDFLTDSSLVCTELIFKAYAPDTGYRGLRLPLEQVMGQMVTPANAIARQFQQQWGTPLQQMDLVLFIDGFEYDRTAVEADISDFLKSWQRPKWHIFIQSQPPETP